MMKTLKVLVACEFSGVVRDAFRALGHDAWSNDLLSSEVDGPHIRGDCMAALSSHEWDLAILHPPCTRIALCGNATYGRGMPKHAARIEAINWTRALWEKAINGANKNIRVAMENPKNVMGPVIGKRTQAIQPWQFGHMEQKETWLWLHNLPPLKPTKDVYEAMMKLPRNERERLHFMSPSANRGHERSRTFPGIASAMAAQWGALTPTP